MSHSSMLQTRRRKQKARKKAASLARKAAKLGKGSAKSAPRYTPKKSAA